jgi:hypothetical protein
VREVVEWLILLAGYHAYLEMLDHFVEHIVSLPVVHVQVGFHVWDVILNSNLLIEFIGKFRGHRPLWGLVAVIGVLAGGGSLHLVHTWA